MQNKKTIHEKNLSFNDHLVFSIFPLHVRRSLSYIIKDASIEGLLNSLTNKGLMDQWNS